MESPYNHDSLQVHCIIHVPVNHLSQVSSAKLLQFKTETATTPCPIILEEGGERERVEYVSLLIGTHTYNVIYMHFILLFLLLLLQCMLLECTHCFVALNMHENQQHPPHLNKPYNYASMQSGLSTVQPRLSGPRLSGPSIIRTSWRPENALLRMRIRRGQ